METINKSVLTGGINHLHRKHKIKHLVDNALTVLGKSGPRLFGRKAMQEVSAIQLNQWVKDFLIPGKQSTNTSMSSAASKDGSQMSFVDCPEAPIYLKQFIGLDAC